MALNKFYKRSNISALEQQVGGALAEIENSSVELKAALKFVFISSVQDFTQQLGSKKQVYLVLIPFPCLKPYLKVSKKLIPELERRVKGTILVAAKRQIQSKWIKQHRSQTRPRSRTLTTVYDGLLEDLCSPGTVIGRRIRVRVDGSRYYKVFLDQADQKDLESRLEAIHGVYKALTTRDAQLEFRADNVFYQLKQKKKPVA